jgi:cytochrome c oxidase assembly protein subunit 15
VLTGLNPYVVAVHFVLAIALLTTTTLTWHRARQSIGVSVPAGGGGVTRVSTGLSAALVVVTLLLIMAGTLVTGSGQHSGDSADVPRMDFAWADVTVAHAILGSAVLVLAVALLVTLRGAQANVLARRRVVAFLAVTIAQALVGVVQALTGVPAVLVAIHVLGSALVWVGVLRVLLDVNPTLFATVRATVDDAPAGVIAR